MPLFPDSCCVPAQETDSSFVKIVASGESQAVYPVKKDICRPSAFPDLRLQGPSDGDGMCACFGSFLPDKMFSGAISKNKFVSYALCRANHDEEQFSELLHVSRRLRCPRRSAQNSIKGQNANPQPPPFQLVTLGYPLRSIERQLVCGFQKRLRFSSLQPVD